MFGTIHETLFRVETRLTKIELKSNLLENRLQKIVKEMTNLNNSTGNFSKVKTFDIFMQSMKKTVTEVETSANAMSEIFDSVKTGISQDLQQVKRTNGQLESKLSSSISDSRRIRNSKTLSLTDLRSRSMRDDLIFTAIPEKTQRH